MLSDQEVFDKVVRHLRAQKRQCRIKDPDSETGWSCLYRGPDGMKCAAGCLIADEHYTPELEGRNCSNHRIRYALAKSGVISLALFSSLVQRLQTLHDRSPPSIWEIEFQNIAKEYSLTVPAP